MGSSFLHCFLLCACESKWECVCLDRSVCACVCVGGGGGPHMFCIVISLMMHKKVRPLVFWCGSLETRPYI